MKIEKLRELTEKELEEELRKTKNELFNLRFQHVTGQLENPIRMKDVKRDVARIKTVIRENELLRENELAKKGQAIG